MAKRSAVEGVGSTAGINIIEIEKRPVPELDASSAAAVATLQNHPGFLYLLAKLAAQRAALREALVKNRHKEIRDVEFLQSGANWCGWLEDQLSAAVALQNRPQPRVAKPYEEEAFEQLRRRIDVVGLQSSQETTPGF